MNFRDVIMGFAGAFNSMNARAQQMRDTSEASSIIWMIDDDGAHVIDQDKLLVAMDAFLTVLETNDVVLKVKTEDVK